MNDDFPPGEKEYLEKYGPDIPSKKVARRLAAVTSWPELNRLIRDLKAGRPMTPHHRGEDGKGSASYERYGDDLE